MDNIRWRKLACFPSPYHELIDRVRAGAAPFGCIQGMLQGFAEIEGCLSVAGIELCATHGLARPSGRLAQVRHVGAGGEVLLIVAAGEAQAGAAERVVVDRLQRHEVAVVGLDERVVVDAVVADQ